MGFNIMLLGRISVPSFKHILESVAFFIDYETNLLLRICRYPRLSILLKPIRIQTSIAIIKIDISNYAFMGYSPVRIYSAYSFGDNLANSH